MLVGSGEFVYGYLGRLNEMKDPVKGTIRRPKGCKEPIIRLHGHGDLYLPESQEAIEVPRVPDAWDMILADMFEECDDVARREGEKR